MVAMVTTRLRQWGRAQGAEGWGHPRNCVGSSWPMSCYLVHEYISLQIPVLCLRFGNALGWLSLLFFLHGLLSKRQYLCQGDSSHHMEAGGERCQGSGWVSDSVQVLTLMDGLRHWPSVHAAPLLESAENSEETSSTWQHYTIVCSSHLGVSIELLSSVFSA